MGAPPPGCPGAQTPPSALAPPPLPLPLPAGAALLGVRARMAAENEASQESALGAYSPVDYMSITSFPRLPEDEPAPAAPLRGRKDEDAFLGDPDTGKALWPYPCPALLVVMGSSVLLLLFWASTFSLPSPSFILSSWTSSLLPQLC